MYYYWCYCCTKKHKKCCIWSWYINNPISIFYHENIRCFNETILVKKEKKILFWTLLWFSWASGNNVFRHRLQYAGMILKLILHVLELDRGHTRQYAGTELSKSWALFYMCWCWTVALQSFRSPSVDMKARVCPVTSCCSLLSCHRPCRSWMLGSHSLAVPSTPVQLGAPQRPPGLVSLPPKLLFCLVWNFAPIAAPVSLFSYIAIMRHIRDDKYQPLRQMVPQIQWANSSFHNR